MLFRYRVSLLAVTAALAASVTSCSDGGSPGTSPGKAKDAIGSLPRVNWEGGPAYWERFRNAKAAGWSDPSFFPIGIWFDSVGSDAEIQYDKKMGFNTYVAGDVSMPYDLFARNGAFWVGGKLAGTPDRAATNWVGSFLDDEVDGRFPAAEGRRILQRERAGVTSDRFAYANFTNLVVNRDMPTADAQAFVNEFTDVVSADMYWYTVPHCDRKPYYSSFLVDIPQKYCRTSASYGALVDMLRTQDAVDGKLQPIWQFVELLNGAGAEGPFVAHITPGQLRGAVWNSLIHEARGVVYFNQSLFGPCRGGNILRQSQVEKNFCGAAQVAAAGKVNHEVLTLAPALNTQSYAFTFGPNLSTMLKVHDGNAYIFAMVDKTAVGKRTLTLPAGIGAGEAEVMFENRKVTIKDGVLVDTFAAEYDCHIYRVRLA